MAEVRKDQKQTSTGTAQTNSLRCFRPSSLTVVVTANQHLFTAKGTSNGTAQYAITVTSRIVDLVFFAGADGTVTDPGHVGLVIGDGKMVEAYATGFPIRVSSYTNRGAIGFTRPAPNAKVSPGDPNSSAAPPVGGIPTPGVTAPGTPASRRGR